VPAVIRIEVHPYLAQDELRAEQVAKAPAEVSPRWHRQRGDIVLPFDFLPATAAA
jgi:hypothetical protein